MNDKSWKICDFNMCSVAGNICMMPTNTVDFAKQSSMNYSYGADVRNGFGSEVGADVGFAIGSVGRHEALGFIGVEHGPHQLPPGQT